MERGTLNLAVKNITKFRDFSEEIYFTVGAGAASAAAAFAMFTSAAVYRSFDSIINQLVNKIEPTTSCILTNREDEFYHNYIRVHQNRENDKRLRYEIQILFNIVICQNNNIINVILAILIFVLFI